MNFPFSSVTVTASSTSVDLGSDDQARVVLLFGRSALRRLGGGSLLLGGLGLLRLHSEQKTTEGYQQKAMHGNHNCRTYSIATQSTAPCLRHPARLTPDAGLQHL